MLLDKEAVSQTDDLHREPKYLYLSRDSHNILLIRQHNVYVSAVCMCIMGLEHPSNQHLSVGHVTFCLSAQLKPYMELSTIGAHLVAAISVN